MTIDGQGKSDGEKACSLKWQRLQLNDRRSVLWVLYHWEDSSAHRCLPPSACPKDAPGKFNTVMVPTEDFYLTLTNPGLLVGENPTSLMVGKHSTRRLPQITKIIGIQQVVLGLCFSLPVRRPVLHRSWNLDVVSSGYALPMSASMERAFDTIFLPPPHFDDRPSEPFHRAGSLKTSAVKLQVPALC